MTTTKTFLGVEPETPAPQRSETPSPSANWFGLSSQDVLTRWCSEGSMLCYGSQQAFAFASGGINDAIASNDVQRVNSWEVVTRWMNDFEAGIMRGHETFH